jgi:tetratricopeptide (TPR) repeat protein
VLRLPVAILLVTTSAGIARADGFWDGVVHPHAAEIAKLQAEAAAFEAKATGYYASYPLQRGAYNKLLAEAVKRYQRAVTLDPENVDLLHRLGAEAYLGSQFDVAVDAFGRSLELGGALADPTQISEYAKSEIMLERWDDAVETLQRGVEVITDDAQRADLEKLLGIAFMGEGRLEDAIAAFRDAQTHAPDDQWALFAVAIALDRDEQLVSANEALQDVAHNDPSFEFFTDDTAWPPAQTYSPAAERHYWQALVYETMTPPRLPEAATEWRAYLDSAEPLYRRRAEERLKEVKDEIAKRVKKTK